ncbi:MAG: succinate dehydrogenase [Thiomonas delicata]|jgi:fumarate reductase subunit C|uniref:Putative Fumarate reductase respiratory complex transmembrane subunit n=1 Tax=Thiomonas delicata TaxID=364030 RepID=A0A238D249_THIDL|nr:MULTISPECIES: succinate dehydrogenase [Thiomonas]SBP87347.1 putative Fumarate reductase respiratory complex transmembrane subunit [Thiomonas delicata]
MSARMQVRLWLWQRISAALLAPLVLIHLGTIIYAVHAGLSAAAILGRLHGNLWFGGFYALFVLACAVHAPIGVAKMAEEWLGWRGARVTSLAAVFALLLLAGGLRAVYGVVLS